MHLSCESCCRGFRSSLTSSVFLHRHKSSSCVVLRRDREMRHSGCPSDTRLLHYLVSFHALSEKHYLLFKQGNNSLNPFSGERSCFTQRALLLTCDAPQTHTGLTITREVTHMSKHSAPSSQRHFRTISCLSM